MDRTVKILLAVGVLLTGTSVAMLFRRPAPASARPGSPSGEPLILRERIEPRASTFVRDRPTAPVESPPAEFSVAAQLPTILRPMDLGQPPPELARAYPGVSRVPNSSRRLPAGYGDAAASSGWQTHEIVDGDTLTALAERYLGSSSRYMKIFEANQDVLSTPELLPIGTKLKIPPPASETKDSPARDDKRLVPVAPRQEREALGKTAG